MLKRFKRLPKFPSKCVMILQLKYNVQDFFFWYLIVIHVFFYGKCYKSSNTSFSAKKAYSNSADPDHTASDLNLPFLLS